MRIITTNLLNRFWKNGVKPIKDSVTKKLDAAKIVNNLTTTASGYGLDARQGKALNDKVAELNGNIPQIQSGIGTLMYVNYAVCEGTVGFEEAFASNPKIIITPIVPSNFNANRNSITEATYCISSANTTGFGLRAFSAPDYDFFSGETIQFYWLAIL